MLSLPYLDSSRRTCVKRNEKAEEGKDELEEVEGSDTEALRVRSGVENSCELKYLNNNMQFRH